MRQLEGRSALVTGGSRGIGAAIARRLAREGANVAITYARSGDRAREVVEDMTALGVRALAVRAEATDVDALRDAVARAATAFGGLDVLVNNAGIAAHGPFEDVTVDAVDRILAIHARAAFVLVQAAVPHMGAGGRIVGVGSSLAERVPYPGWALYAMSKSALIGLTKGLARDLGPRGITANLVNPGPTDTASNPADGPMADTIAGLTALGRYARPEEIADVVAYLAGPGAGYLTGAVVDVDGGFSA